MKRAARTAGCAALAVAVSVQTSYAQDGRDLTQYDKAGPFSADMAHSEQHAQVTAQIREAIWEHWMTKSRLYLVADLVSREGTRGHSEVFVEPDPGRARAWRVVIEGWSEVLAYHGMQLDEHGIPIADAKRVARTATYRKVERIQPRNKRGRSVLIKSDKWLPGTEFLLRLVPEDGQPDEW